MKIIFKVGRIYLNEYRIKYMQVSNIDFDIVMHRDWKARLFLESPHSPPNSGFSHFLHS